MRRILIIDNNLVSYCHRCYRFREHVRARYNVIISSADKLPESVHTYSHVVLTGGSGRLDALDPRARKLSQFIRMVADSGTPLLGICFGHEAIAATFAPEPALEHFRHPNTGWTRIERTAQSRLLTDVPQHFYAFEHHKDDVLHLPADFVITARSHRTPIEAFEHTTRPIFGVQFHPDIRRRRALQLLAQFRIERPPASWRSGDDMRHFSPAIHQRIFHNFYACEPALSTSAEH